jgi:hypothetical protein
MPDLEDGHNLLVVIYLVYHPVIPYSDPPAVYSLEPTASTRTRIIREGLQSALYAVLDIRGESGYLFLCPPLDGYGVDH